MLCQLCSACGLRISKYWMSISHANYSWSKASNDMFITQKIALFELSFGYVCVQFTVRQCAIFRFTLIHCELHRILSILSSQFSAPRLAYTWNFVCTDFSVEMYFEQSGERFNGNLRRVNGWRIMCVCVCERANVGGSEFDYACISTRLLALWSIGKQYPISPSVT